MRKNDFKELQNLELLSYLGGADTRLLDLVHLRQGGSVAECACSCYLLGIVQEQLEVAHSHELPLPAFLHASDLRHFDVTLVGRANA